MSVGSEWFDIPRWRVYYECVAYPFFMERTNGKLATYTAEEQYERMEEAFPGISRNEVSRCRDAYQAKLRSHLKAIDNARTKGLSQLRKVKEEGPDLIIAKSIGTQTSGTIWCVGRRNTMIPITLKGYASETDVKYHRDPQANIGLIQEFNPRPLTSKTKRSIAMEVGSILNQTLAAIIIDIE
jgi:hypothetical protein